VKTQRSADIWSGAFLAALGLVVLAAAWNIRGGLEERLPPRTLPYTMGITILVSGILLVIRAWRYSGENPPIQWPDATGARRIIVTLVSLAVYIALINPLGMPISTALYLAFQVWYLSRGRYRVLSALLTGVISGVVVYYLFIRFLELSFPVGLLQR
jgi:putative tricarboxylic transport membrane protein